MINTEADYEEAKRRRDKIADDLRQEEDSLKRLGLSPKELQKEKSLPGRKYARLKNQLDQLEKEIKAYERDNPHPRGAVIHNEADYEEAKRRRARLQKDLDELDKEIEAYERDTPR
jgi:chromosome segregation ATPase